LSSLIKMGMNVGTGTTTEGKERLDERIKEFMDVIDSTLLKRGEVIGIVETNKGNSPSFIIPAIFVDIDEEGLIVNGVGMYSERNKMVDFKHSEDSVYKYESIRVLQIKGIYYLFD
jgi:hypothetical protein